MPSDSYNFIWRCAKCSNHFANITKMDGILKQEKKCPKCKSINIITLANKEMFVHYKFYDPGTNGYRSEFENSYPYPENEAPVRPRATKVITVVHYFGELKEGRYMSEAIITLNGEEKHRNDFHFTVGNSDEVKVLGWFGSFGKSIDFINLFLLKIIIMVAVTMIIATIFIKNSFLRNKLAKIIAIKK